jgi:hypothetical protein
MDRIKTARLAMALALIGMTSCPGCDSAEECQKMCGEHGVMRHENSGQCECNSCQLDRATRGAQ